MVDALAPDIMLVDINMPFLNGLEMIEHLRSRNEEMRLIVVTGYEEFAYAKRALELGVSAYLLKPVEADELRQALTSAMTDLSARRARGRHLAWAMTQLEKRRDALREAFLREAIEGQLEAEALGEPARFFGVDDLRRYALLLIEIAPGDTPEPPLRRMAARYAVEGAVSGVMAACRRHFPFSDDRGNLLYLYDGDEAGDASLCEHVRQAVQTETGDRARVFQAAGAGLAALPEMYDSLLEALESGTPAGTVEAARRYILSHYRRPGLGLEEVAEEAGVNPSYLSRLMKQSLGMSFNKYLTAVRIDRATRLMRDSRLLLKDIAERVGYASPYYFSTAFKRALGVSPAEYRSEVDEP